MYILFFKDMLSKNFNRINLTSNEVLLINDAVYSVVIPFAIYPILQRYAFKERVLTE